MQATSTPAQDTQEEHLKQAEQLAAEVKFCMFTAVEHTGKLISAPMTTQHFESFSEQIWFIGSRKSLLVQALQTNPAVNLSYADNASKDYLSVSGTATLVSDQAKLDELWSDFYNVYFDGVHDPEIQLISVEASSLEYWKSNGTLMNLYQMSKALLTDSKANLGESHSMRVN